MGVFTRSDPSDSDPEFDPGDADGARPSNRDRVKAIGAVVALTVAALVVSLIGGIAFVVPVFIFELDLESTPVFLALTAAGQLGFVVAAYAYARHRGLRVRVAPPGRSDALLAVAGTVAALAVATVLLAVLRALGLVPGSVIGEAVTRDPTLLLGLAALSVVLVAPAEEFLFRGVVQGRLREAFGPVGAIAGSSLLFGSIHLSNYTGAPGPVVAGALLIAGTGVVLGSIYERTGNLAVPILAHASYNVVLSLGTYAAG